MTKATTEATQSEDAPAAKSIVDPKYRDKYKNRSEWMADYLKANCSTFKTIPAKPADGDKPAVEERQVNTGVDVDALFALARANGLNVDKYDNQRDGHGFPGRFRMTIGNMLRATAKQRHGFKDADGTFMDAPEEWLTAVGAPAEPTHDQDGVKLAKAKPEGEAEVKQPESKLIKKEAAPPAKQPAPAAKPKKK